MIGGEVESMVRTWEVFHWLTSSPKKSFAAARMAGVKIARSAIENQLSLNNTDTMSTLGVSAYDLRRENVFSPTMSDAKS